LDEKGIPTPVERTFICPPGGRIGPATDNERAQTIRTSNIYGFYEKQVDRESAYEILKARAAESAPAAAEEGGFDWGGILGGGSDKKKAAVVQTAYWKLRLKVSRARWVQSWVVRLYVAFWAAY